MRNLFPKMVLSCIYSRLLVKKLLIEPASADMESRLAVTMAHDFMGGEGISNKRGTAPLPLKQLPKGRPNLFLPLPTKK